MAWCVEYWDRDRGVLMRTPDRATKESAIAEAEAYKRRGRHQVLSVLGSPIEPLRKPIVIVV